MGKKRWAPSEGEVVKYLESDGEKWELSSGQGAVLVHWRDGAPIYRTLPEGENRITTDTVAIYRRPLARTVVQLTPLLGGEDVGEKVRVFCYANLNFKVIDEADSAEKFMERVVDGGNVAQDRLEEILSHSTITNFVASQIVGKSAQELRKDNLLSVEEGAESVIGCHARYFGLSMRGKVLLTNKDYEDQIELRFATAETEKTIRWKKLESSVNEELAAFNRTVANLYASQRELELEKKLKEEMPEHYQEMIGLWKDRWEQVILRCVSSYEDKYNETLSFYVELEEYKKMLERQRSELQQNFDIKRMEIEHNSSIAELKGKHQTTMDRILFDQDIYVKKTLVEFKEHVKQLPEIIKMRAFFKTVVPLVINRNIINELQRYTDEKLTKEEIIDLLKHQMSSTFITPNAGTVNL